MSEKFAIGIDLGGTNLRSGLVDRSGRVAHRSAMPVGEDKSAERIIQLLLGEIGRLKGQAAGDVAAVGVGIPGIVHFERGVVHSSPNFPMWRDVAVRELIAGGVDLPLAVDNDANLHALGEKRFGAGRGHRDFVLLSLGTGIGGGLILDDDIFRGDEGFAGEVGHMVVEAQGMPCRCGGRGCWELYAASRAFASFAEGLSEKERSGLLSVAMADAASLTPETLAAKARAGNAAALKLWEMFARYLGAGIASLANILGVFTFIIGGGIARSWELFGDAAHRFALSHTYKAHAARLVIKRAELRDDAGIIGAASLAFDSAR